MSYKRVLQTIRRHDSFLVASHIGPDLDAISSSLVMGLLLKAMGKKVTIINEDAVPERYRFAPRTHMMRQVERIRRKGNHDVLIAVDCGDKKRIGTVNDYWKGDTIINIDHHVTNTRFGDVNLVISTASSTAEIIYELILKSGVSLTKDMAHLLYLGILTDTGSFRYESTTARTHVIASDLMRFNIPVNAYYQKIYETTPLDDMRLFMKLMNGVEYLYKGRVAVVTITKSMLKKFSEVFDLKEMMFSVLRSIEGVDVVVVVTEVSTKETRVNFRSQSRVDVSKIAAGFGGGGHKKASGCTVDASLAQAKRKVMRVVRNKVC